MLVDGSREKVDAWVVRKGQKLTALVTNHVGPRRPVKTEQVQLVLHNAPGKCYAYVERIDETHANPQRVWRETGERVKDDLQLDFILPPHAVAAVTVEFPSVNGRGGART